MTKSRTLVTAKVADVAAVAPFDLVRECWISETLTATSLVTVEGESASVGGGRLLFDAATILCPIGGCVSLRGRTAPAVLPPFVILTHYGDAYLTPQPLWARTDTA